MIYVISDIHGRYDKYIKMLEKIEFGEEDTLYVLGDVCDRGDDSAKIYLDIMSRKNVHMIKGNHEMLAEEFLSGLNEKYPEGMNSIQMLELYYRKSLYGWFVNGGDSTVSSFFRHSKAERDAIVDFITALPMYAIEECNGCRYVMVHGGLGEYRDGIALEDIPPRDLAWSQPDFNGTYFDGDNTRLIVGHTPTFLITGSKLPASIYRGTGNVTVVDCGAVFPIYKGRLGCLCLDDNREFYV
ncbi:MAG: metallophosphoesterase [Clostridia bacterium]|nr:metallophosphoesterase [Clostridia bacterium]